MPLPFISYGGNAMIAALVSAGVLLNISQQAE
jgi:cell division protein FtsW (lipid II flippase)